MQPNAMTSNSCELKRARGRMLHARLCLNFNTVIGTKRILIKYDFNYRRLSAY